MFRTPGAVKGLEGGWGPFQVGFEVGARQGFNYFPIFNFAY